MSMNYMTPTERAMLTCNVCGEEFSNRGDLVTHVRANHSFRHLSPAERPRIRGPHACGECDMTFSTRTAAGQHRRAKHGA